MKRIEGATEEGGAYHKAPGMGHNVSDILQTMLEGNIAIDL